MEIRGRSIDQVDPVIDRAMERRVCFFGARFPPNLPEPSAAKPNPKVAALQKRLATAKKKLDDAKTGGATTRPYEDKVYEIEDELRLALQA